MISFVISELNSSKNYPHQISKTLHEKDTCSVTSIYPFLDLFVEREILTDRIRRTSSVWALQQRHNLDISFLRMHNYFCANEHRCTELKKTQTYCQDT